MNRRFFGSLWVALSIVLTQPAFARRQAETTPFDHFQIKLALKPGKTFLAFMQEKVKPGLDSFQDTIVNDPAMRERNYRRLQENLLEQGAGVAIRIDADNYLFNLGYLDGSDPKNDVKSGRSYGVGPTNAQSDPSDIAYLNELEAYLKAEPQSAGVFVETLMKLLTNCDTSGWSRLSADGQIVATDFLAIYTAELDRHLMVGLRPTTHPWEIDLAAATFVSIFSVETGLVMQDRALVSGGLKLWWAQGVTGSGIGNTRRDRLALQKLIARYEADSKPASELASAVGLEPGDDLIQGVLLYLNSFEAPTEMGSQGKKLAQLLAQYLGQVQAHATAIAELQ